MLSFAKMIQTSRLILIPRLAASSGTVDTATRANSSLRSLKHSEERLVIPPKPKKPLTPFFRYLVETRSKVAKENPQFTPVQLVRAIAVKWNDVSVEAKKKLNDEYLKEKEVWVKQLASYTSKLTDEQKQQLKDVKQELVHSREKRAINKKSREMDKPKKPASGFLRFLQQEYKARSGDVKNYREFLTILALEWQKLPDDKKKAFNDAYAKENVTYRQDMAKWELKMIRQGNTELVRKEALIDATPPKLTKPVGRPARPAKY